ncbi:MAG: hypothetical protein Q8867_04050 [Bacteroidota bacterium]|nr:hypothetical protein [Bacteroidota bacterium]
MEDIMDGKQRKGMMIHGHTSLKQAISVFFLYILLGSGWTYAQQETLKTVISPEQQQRLDLMKSKSINASLTIFPVWVVGKPWDRVSEIIGLLLERKGLKDIELDKTVFGTNQKSNLQDLADSLGKFVKGHSVKTDFVLYSEMNGDKEKHLINELRTVIVDKTGAVVWTDIQTSQDEAFKKVDDPDPMGFSILLVDRLSPQLGLNEETEKNAKPGKMESIMNERSGIPSPDELSPIPERQKLLKESCKKSTLMIFPVRMGEDVSKTRADNLVKLIKEAGLCNTILAKDSILLKSSRENPNEMKVLWDLARDFRDYIKKNPKEADYVLYADYTFNPQNWQQGYVHFVICDRNGEWVIVDMQNSLHPDFQGIKPKSGEGCDKLLVNRLKNYFKWSVAEAIRDVIQSSGVDAAASKFKEICNNKDYHLSEEEMNALGYDFLRANKLKEAIEVFKLNVEAFPKSYNTYDSLGEAYAAAGEKNLAIKNYEKSLELNPDSKSGIEALKKLK